MGMRENKGQLWGSNCTDTWVRVEEYADSLTEWSVGSPVKDASFASHSFNDWTKAPAESADNTVTHNGEGKC